MTRVRAARSRRRVSRTSRPATRTVAPSIASSPRCRSRDRAAVVRSDPERDPRPDGQLHHPLDRERGRDPSEDPPDAFVDDNGNVHEANINKLAAAGVVSGKTAESFAPGQHVSRAQMATFIARAVEASTTRSRPRAGDYFGDDDQSTHQANINRVPAVGITTGTSGAPPPAQRTGPSGPDGVLPGPRPSTSSSRSRARRSRDQARTLRWTLRREVGITVLRDPTVVFRVQVASSRASIGRATGDSSSQLSSQPCSTVADALRRRCGAGRRRRTAPAGGSRRWGTSSGQSSATLRLGLDHRRVPGGVVVGELERGREAPVAAPAARRAAPRARCRARRRRRRRARSTRKSVHLVDEETPATPAGPAASGAVREHELAARASARGRPMRSACSRVVEVDLPDARLLADVAGDLAQHAEVLEQEEDAPQDLPSSRSPSRVNVEVGHHELRRTVLPRPATLRGLATSIWCSSRYSGSFIGLLTSSVGRVDLGRDLAVDALLQVAAERRRASGPGRPIIRSTNSGSVGAAELARRGRRTSRS